MNTFKKKSLYAALAGVSALGATGAAQAVSVNPDGLGQALIYPYYTVRDKVAGAPFASLLSVVNSTASAKAVKVRFLEGKNSREVLDFNLYLSKRDVWVAAVIAIRRWRRHLHERQVLHDADGLVERRQPDAVRELRVCRLGGGQRRRVARPHP